MGSVCGSGGTKRRADHRNVPGLPEVYRRWSNFRWSQRIMQVSDRYRPTPNVKISHPEWSKNAVIYQINTRHFTREGTFAAAEKHLPRLKELGVDILWLMPIHEIGQKYRKGNLGSPYAVKDYYQVNSEFGTLADIKQFVASAHQQGMYVILDWVANHTAWDNDLVNEHSDWYAR